MQPLYPDQDILDHAMSHDPTDVRQSAAFSTNLVSGNAYHSFVADSHKKEQHLGRSRRLKLWDAEIPWPPTVHEWLALAHEAVLAGDSGAFWRHHQE